MKILYIYRNKSLGFSIAKVFHTIELEMKRYAEVDSFYLPIAGAKPWSLWKNIQAAYKKANSQPYDIIHITGSEHYLIPFLSYRHKIIVTVHDLGFFTNEKKSLRTFYLYLLWIKTLKYANIITCVSKKTEKEGKPPVKYVFSATSSTCIFVPKNETYDDTRRSCRNYYVLQGTQSNL